jgi:hypothetical protein
MADDPNTMLFQQLLGKTGEKPTMQGLLAQVAETNPNLAPLANYLIQREAERREQEAREEAEITVEQLPDRRDSLKNLELTVHKLYRELEDLRERNDALAAALGACYLCWGDDFQCPYCHGQGATGWRSPDPDLFGQWIKPILHVRRHMQLNGNSREPESNEPPSDPSLQS